MHNDLAPWAIAHLDPGWIEHTLVKEAVVQMLEICRTETWQNVAAFVAQCSNPLTQQLVTEVSTLDRPMPNPEQQLKDITIGLRNRFITQQLSGLLQRVEDPELSDEQRVGLLRQVQELRALKGRPLAG